MEMRAKEITDEYLHIREKQRNERIEEAIKVFQPPPSPEMVAESPKASISEDVEDGTDSQKQHKISIVSKDGPEASKETEIKTGNHLYNATILISQLIDKE